MMSTAIAEKPYTICSEPRADYLYVHVSGETDSLEISLQFWREIRDLSRQHNALKVLVLENFQNTLDIIDIYALNNRVSQMGFFNTRIAFVDEKQAQNELNTMAERIAAIRGLHLRVFPSVPEAEAWLLN